MRSRAPTAALLLAIPLGVALGVFSLVGDVLPVEGALSVLNGLANATGPWVLVAFVAGIVQRRPQRGAVAGSIALAVAVATYYVGFRIAWGDNLVDVRLTTVVWFVAAWLAGSILGAAGGAWPGPGQRGRVVATAVVCGALLAEVAYRFAQTRVWDGIDPTHPPTQAALVDLVVAAALPLALSGRRSRTTAYASSVGFAFVGLMALSIVTELARNAIPRS